LSKYKLKAENQLPNSQSQTDLNFPSTFIFSAVNPQSAEWKPTSNVFSMSASTPQAGHLPLKPRQTPLNSCVTCSTSRDLSFRCCHWHCAESENEKLGVFMCSYDEI
jgi:hypothetical protein